MQAVTRGAGGGVVVEMSVSKGEVNKRSHTAVVLEMSNGTLAVCSTTARTTLSFVSGSTQTVEQASNVRVCDEMSRPTICAVLPTGSEVRTLT